jgi:thiaminase (transcriptional activator TenA)
MAGGESFRNQLWEANRDLWGEIGSMPFVREVGAGTLDERSFAFFIAEDLLYLDEFARVLATGATWATTPETRQMFLEHAATVYVVEQTLHSSLAPSLALDVEAIRERDPKPVTAAYTNHLHRAASTGPLAGLVAAVLPCYWVYNRVGEQLAASPPDHEIYRTWIASYASPEFGESVEAQLSLIDELGAAADEELRERLHRWFRQSLRYEWMFWDQAYRKADWPVGEE